jgi:hypothetical protein
MPVAAARRRITRLDTGDDIFKPRHSMCHVTALLKKMSLRMQYPFEFFRRDAGVLHGVGWLFMAKLFLNCGDVASLRNNVFPHSMAGTMGRSAMDIKATHGDLGESPPVFMSHMCPLAEQHPIRKKSFFG